MENRLPEGINLGHYDGRATYVETCTCASTWCNAPTAFYQGTDEVCIPQTKELRVNQTVCGHFVDISQFEKQAMGLDEALT